MTNVDLDKFQYVKYPKTTLKPFFFRRHGQLFSIRKIPDPPTKFEDTINRAKAAVKYFRDLAFGNPAHRIKSEMVLDPSFGRKWSDAYQAKHGKHGEKLVELIGSGPSKEKLIESGLINGK